MIGYGMKHILALSVSVLMLAACAPANDGPSSTPSEDTPVTETAAEPAPLMKWSDLLSRPVPKTPHTLKTGNRDTDVADLWLPDGPGPHPVIVMIHGGCWQKGIADRTLMNYAAEDLRQRGLAVWNIEYRGVDEAGGGYPGTFQDVAKTADALRDHVEKFNLKTDKIAAFGHSAGGHLAAWLSTRENISENSRVYTNDPLPLYAIVNSGGLADLEASAPVTFDGCLANIMGQLVGAPNKRRPSVFSDTTAVNLFPTATRQISVNGDQDNIAPPVLGQGYTDKATAAGVDAEFIQVENTGHVELVSPGTDAFERQARILENLVK